MSAGWGNSFSLLDEDESGEGAVRVPVKAAAPVAAKPTKEEPKAASKNTAVVDNKEANRKEVARQNPDRRPPRAREERSGEDNQQQQGERSFNNNRLRAPGGDRSNEQRRERRPDQQHTGTDGTTRAPRQYDRKSGTGRGREEKRGGAGRGNWGSNEDEIAALDQHQSATAAAAAADNVDATADAAADASADTAADAAPQQQEKEAKPVRELTEEEKQRIADREAEAKLMTLDEYMKQKKSLSYELPAQRKAGEGEDQKQWAGFVAAKSEKTAEQEEAAKKASAGASSSGEERKAKEAKKVPVPADLLRFRGEQQRRDVERRESRPRDSDSSRGPRRDDAPRAPRAPKPAAANTSNKPAAEFQLATDFPALKV